MRHCCWIAPLQSHTWTRAPLLFKLFASASRHLPAPLLISPPQRCHCCSCVPLHCHTCTRPPLTSCSGELTSRQFPAPLNTWMAPPPRLGTCGTPPHASNVASNTHDPARMPTTRGFIGVLRVN